MNAASINVNARAAPEFQPLWQTLRQFPRPVWILFAGTFINKFGTFVVPFLALHLTRLGYSPRVAGLGLMAYGAGVATASILGGHLADSMGRRQTIVLSTFSGAIAMMLLSQAQGLASILALAYLTGVTAEFYKPASSALLADLVAPENRVTAYAAYRFSINAGWAFGPAVAGLLAQHSYFWLFAGDAATACAFGVIALVLLPREPGGRGFDWSFAAAAFASVAEAGQVALRDRRFCRLLAALLAMALVFMQMPTTLGLEIKAAGYTEQVYGLVLGLNGLLVVLCEIPLSTWLRRQPPRPLIATGFALIGCGVGLNGWASQPWQYAVAMAVMTSGEICSISVSLAYAASLAPEKMRGRYMGIYGLTWAVALLCGPVIGMWIFGHSPAALWAGCALLGLLAAAIISGKANVRDETKG